MIRPARLIGCIAILVSILGCHPAVSNVALVELSKGVSDVRSQSDTAFEDVNALVRENATRYLLATTRPTFNEDDVSAFIDAETRNQWDGALALLQTYITGLQTLHAKSTGSDFTDAAVALGEQLSRGATRIQIDPRIATAATQIGQALIQSKAQRQLLQVMRETDPFFRETLAAMAAAIGETNQEAGSLRLIVSTNAQIRFAESVRLFANSTDSANKAVAVQRAVDVINQRDAQLAALVSLRGSLFLLADAHTAASQGERATAAAILTAITGELERTRSLLGRYQAINNPTR